MTDPHSVPPWRPCDPLKSSPPAPNPPPPPHLLVSTLGMWRFQIDAIFKDSSLETVSKIVHSHQLYYEYFCGYEKGRQKKETAVFQKSIRRRWSLSHRTKMSWKFYHKGWWFSLLNDVFLFHRFVAQYTFVAKCRKINCLKTAVHYQLTDGSPCCRRLLYTMTAKAVYKNKIPYLGMTSYYAILIQCVVFIVTSPSALNLYHESEKYNSYQTFKQGRAKSTLAWARNLNQNRPSTPTL